MNSKGITLKDLVNSKYSLELEKTCPTSEISYEEKEYIQQIKFLKQFEVSSY